MPDNGKILNRLGYRLGATLGKGTYSKVCMCTNTRGANFACKIIDKNKAGKDFIKKFLPRELKILSLVKHPNIVEVHRVFEIGNVVYLIMDYCERGDLLEYLKANGSLYEEKAKFIFGQITNAVHYLHNLDIAHRDLKCENVLLLPNYRAKLADFGFARYCRNSNGSYILSDTFCGSAAYAAPEILMGHNYDPKMYDIWALGCILYTMLKAALPFDDSNINKMVAQQNSDKIKECTKFWEKDLKLLLLALLELDPSKRININQIVRHDWFKIDCNVKKNKLLSASDSYLL